MKKNVVENIKKSESAISMFLGIGVVAVSGILLFNYFKTYFNKPEEIEETNETQTETFLEQAEEGKPSFSGELPAKYVVEKNDSLWDISIKFFGYGYNWTDISAENNLSNPNSIEQGQELTIPNVVVKRPILAQEKKNNSIEKIEETTYEVKRGDTLWDISVRAYQDGYKWIEIAKANKLTDPNLIHTGNKLIIPR